MLGNPFQLQNDISDLHDRQVRRSAGTWVAEEVPVGQASGWLRRGMPRGRLLAFVVAGLLLAVTLLGRLVQVQVVGGAGYRLLAEGNRIRTVVLSAPRGLVRDARGRDLVLNEPSFAVYLVPAQLPASPEGRRAVAEQIGRALPAEALPALAQAASSTGFVPVLVVENVSHAAAVSLLVQQPNLPGLLVTTESNRHYVDGESLSAVLGYVRKISPAELEELRPLGYRFTDRLGKAGLERSYEQDLRGQAGEDAVEVDAHGRFVAAVEHRAPVVGKHLDLYLDLELQQRLTESLRHWAGRHGAAAVALDARTGGVLALVSLPTFDLNTFSSSTAGEEVQRLLTDPRQPLFNRAIAGQYPSGSTIKPLLVAAAVEEGIIDERTTVLSTGGLAVGEWFFPDWRAGGHGVTDAVKAIADSVNTFFYTIGGGWGEREGLGPERIAEWLRRFGWGSELGLDLPGERPGLVPTPAWKQEQRAEPWYIGDTYHVSIGQGDLLVTPLQVAASTVAIANGGTLFQPHLVRARDGQPVQPVATLSRFLSGSAADLARRGMRAAVTDGSARSLSSLAVEAAGKTGTAQVAGDQPHAWFTGFAPYDEPQIVITVLVENAGEGSSFATPVAREVLEWWVANRLGSPSPR